MASYPLLLEEWGYAAGQGPIVRAWNLDDFTYYFALDDDGYNCLVIESVVKSGGTSTTSDNVPNHFRWQLELKKGNDTIFKFNRLDNENNDDGTHGHSLANKLVFGSNTVVMYGNENIGTLKDGNVLINWTKSGCWLPTTAKFGIPSPNTNMSFIDNENTNLTYKLPIMCTVQHRIRIDPEFIQDADTIVWGCYYQKGGGPSKHIERAFAPPKQDDPPPPPIDPPVPPPPPPPPLTEPIEEPCGYVPQFAGEQVLVYFNGDNLGYVPVDDQGYLPEYWPPLPNPNAVRICDANQLVVGLGFNTEIIPTRPEVQTEQGLTMGLLRKVNAVKAKTYRYVPCLVNVGTSQARWCGQGYKKEVDLQAVPLGAGWRDFENLTITASGPSPATILALITTVELSNFPGKR